VSLTWRAFDHLATLSFVTSTSFARIAGVLMLTSPVACGDSPVGPPAGPAVGSVREGAALYDGLELALQSSWIGWGIEPLPGPRLDALGFRVLNAAPDPRGFDPRAVRVETADGTYWPRVVVGTDPELRPMTLDPSADAFGWIVFRVPAGAKPVAVVWSPAPGLVLRIPLPAPPK